MRIDLYQWTLTIFTNLHKYCSIDVFIIINMKDTVVNNPEVHLYSKESQKGYTILQYRNMGNMIISIIVLFNLAWVRLYGTFRNASLPLIILHLTVDLPFATTELQIHHLLGIFMGCIKWIYNHFKMIFISKNK
jgi:hypothetical protein